MLLGDRVLACTAEGTRLRNACARRATRLALLAVLALGWAVRARADSSAPDPHAVQPERPTIATHAHTVAPGWVEIELGPELDTQAGGQRTLSTSLVTKVGLAPRAQLNVTTPWQSAESGGPTTSGLGDVSLGVKWRPFDHLPVVGDAAGMVTLKMPSGSTAHGLGTGTTDVSALLISSNQIGPVSLDVNLGYTRRSGDGVAVPRNAGLATAAAGFPLFGPVGGAAELFTFPGTSGPAGEPPIVAMLFGPTLTPRPCLEVDAGVIAEISGPEPHGLYCGLVWNIGRL